MWLAFPTSDYYGRSDTCLPHQPQPVHPVKTGRQSGFPRLCVCTLRLSLGCSCTPVPRLLPESLSAAGLYPYSHCRFARADGRFGS